MLTMSSITESTSLKNTSPGLKRFMLSNSLLEEFEERKDEKVQVMNITKVIEKLEEKKKIQENQKLLLDTAKDNSHVREILKSTEKKLVDYQSTESLVGRDSILCLENE